MLVRSWRNVCDLFCCNSCYFGDWEPVVSRSVIEKKRWLKCCLPWTKPQKLTITHIELTRKRQFIINELVETEQRYIEKLKTLDSDFIMPLFKMESECKPLGKLCAQIKLFLRFHKVLLNDLLNGKSIPAVFNKTGFFLELTWGYMNLYPEVSSTIEMLKQKSETFRELIESKELIHQVQLSQLLVEPIERIPRYKLLLQDLQASTPKGHPESNNLEKALKKMVKIILKLKEGRESDSYGTWKSVYKKINGRGQSLWTPVRTFVRKDVFWCVFQSEYFHFFPPSRVRAFLFTNCIIICEDQKVGRRYKFLSEISLSSISSLEYVQDPHISFKRHKIATDVLGFKISAKGHRTFELYHSNHAVLKKWFDLVSKSTAVKTGIESKEKSYQKTRPSSLLNPNLLFGKKSASTIVGSVPIPESRSKYGSVSRYNPGSPCKNDCKSISSSENVGSIIDYGTEYMTSGDDSDYQGVHRPTSMGENMWKVGKKRNGYVKLSNSQLQDSSLGGTSSPIHELRENTPIRKSRNESGSHSLWGGDSFFVAYDSDQEETNQRRYSLKKVELLHSI